MASSMYLSPRLAEWYGLEVALSISLVLLGIGTVLMMISLSIDSAVEDKLSNEHQYDSDIILYRDDRLIKVFMKYINKFKLEVLLF